MRIRNVLPAVLLATALHAQSHEPIPIPLTPEHWEATDSLRFENHLGKPSLFIDRGLALAREVNLQDGVYEFSMAATPQSNFMGAAFHAKAMDFSEILFFRIGQSDTSEAIQYAPAMNNLGAAWQLFHGTGANAKAKLVRERWMRVRIVLSGGKATLFLDGAEAPVLEVPRLAGTGGTRLGVWTGLFGRGAYFTDFSYTPADPAPKPAVAQMPTGTIRDWELSPTLDAESVTPGALPHLPNLQWQRVIVEPNGLVLINRYRAAPTARIPFDPVTRVIDVEAVMGGQVKGSKVVLARAYVESDRDRIQRMHFGYSDGVVIYSNGQPLFFGMNAQFFRGDGIISEAGDAVYLPLKKGRNEIVLAVTELTGGWGFWARLDP